MAEIQDGYTMTVKRGQDLLTIQGVTYESFVSNVKAFFGPQADEVLAAWRPMAFAEKVLTEQESNGDPYAHEGHKPQPKPQAKPKTEKKPFSGEMKNPDDAATENQKDFIWKVAKAQDLGRDEVLSIATQVAGFGVSSLNELTKRQASSVIDAIKQGK